MGAKVYGLVSVKAGSPANDGGMGTTLTELFNATVKGSASLVYTPPSNTELEIEEVDGVFDTFPSSIEKWELKLDTYNVSAANLQKVFGGTVVAAVAGTSGATWKAPLQTVPVYQSVEVTTRSGQVIAMVKVKLQPAPNFNFTKSDAGRLSITGTLVAPDKAATSAITFADPVPAA